MADKNIYGVIDLDKVTPPPVGCYFEVSFFIGGLMPVLWGDCQFNRVSGISSRIRTQDIRVGGSNQYQTRIPEHITHGNLILERGLVSGSYMNWEFNIAMTMLEILPGSVLVVLQEYGNKGLIAAWLFRHTYPVAWSVSDLSSADSVVIDTMELAYSHFYSIRI